MHRRLIRGLSGVLLLLVSMGLLSTIQVVTDVQQLAQRTAAREEQKELTLVDVVDHSGRELGNKKEHNSDIAGPMVETGLLLGDLFIAVKTTQKFHQTRMGLLLDTWISRVRDQTYVFTDKEDEELQAKLGDHLVLTNCSAEYSHPALSCKMAAEFDAFLASGLSWFCHLDDDNYLNPQALLKLLSSYSPDQDVYIGKPSLNRPIHAAEILPNNQTKSIYFWFATGGAGFCISRKLATRMAPWASGRNFLITSELIHLPDDCTVGYIIERRLGGHLVPSALFHSHLENLQQIQRSQLTKQEEAMRTARDLEYAYHHLMLLTQVTLSYGIFEKKLNVIKLGSPFSHQDDPSRHFLVSTASPPVTAGQGHSFHMIGWLVRWKNFLTKMSPELSHVQQSTC